MKLNKSAAGIHPTSFVSVLILVLAMAVMGTGCTRAEKPSEAVASPAEVIRIGIFEPFTGELAEAASPEIQGIELAHKLYPEVAGKTIELVKADNRSNLAGATKAAEDLVKQSVVAVIGSYGNMISIAGGDVFSRAETPAIAVTCTNPLVTAGNPHYFRVCVVDSFQGTMAAKYVVNELKLKQAAVMKALGDDYSTALSGKFSEKMINLTGNPASIVQTIEYTAGAKDFQAPLAAIAATGVEAVYLPGGGADSIKIITQAAAAGLNLQFIGTDCWETEDFLKAVGQSGENIVFTSFSASEEALTDKSEEFRAAWAQTYGAENFPTQDSALGFDAYLMIYQALQKQSQPPEAGMKAQAPLRDLIRDIRNFKGATGSIQFDQSGDPIKPVVFMTVKNGKFIYKYTAVPEWEAN